MIEPEFYYTWPTRLRPHPFLRECTPYNTSGGFRAPVEVVVFPKEKDSTGYSVLSSREYLKRGADLDDGAAAIRFNAETTDPFSVIWEPEVTRGDRQAVGRVHVIGPSWVTTIMRDMIEKSATAQVKKRLDSVLESGTRLNGRHGSSTPRPALTDTGLVKSVSVPPGRLRLLSRLDTELLRPRSTLIHELVLVATLPDAVNEASDVECEIAVFPKGWITMASDPLGPREDVIVLPAPANWARPHDGRTGAGSRYVFESVVRRSHVGLVSPPPPARRPPSGRRGAEVRARLFRGDVELCRLHHPFWIEPPEQPSPSRSAPSPFAEELQHLLDLALLGDADIARATGTPVDVARAWLRDAREPSGDEAERVNELSAIVDRLAGVMAPDFIALWLRKPLRVLDDEKPLDVLAGGDYRRVSRVVASLESPVAS